MDDVESRTDGVLLGEPLMDVHYLSPDEIPSGAQTPNSVDSDRWQHPAYHKHQMAPASSPWMGYSDIPCEADLDSKDRLSSWADLSEDSTTAGTPANNASSAESGSETSPGEEAYASSVSEWVPPPTPQATPQAQPQASAEEMAILAGVMQENAVDVARQAVKMRQLTESCGGSSPWEIFTGAGGSDVGFGDMLGEVDMLGSEICFGEMEMLPAAGAGSDIGFADLDMLGADMGYSADPVLQGSQQAFWSCGADMASQYPSGEEQMQDPDVQCLIPCVLTPVGPPVKIQQAMKNIAEQNGQGMDRNAGADSMAHGQATNNGLDGYEMLGWWPSDDFESQAWNSGDNSVSYFPLDTSNDCWNFHNQVGVPDSQGKTGQLNEGLLHQEADEALCGDGYSNLGRHHPRNSKSSSWNRQCTDTGSVLDDGASAISTVGSEGGRRHLRHGHGTVPKGTQFRVESEDMITTMMLRKIPNRYHSQMLAEELNNLGFKGKMDFVYVPMDQATHWNVGYGFVNFTTPQAAEESVKILTGHKFSAKCHGKYDRDVVVVPAHMQGLRKNLEHYRRTAVQFNKVQTYRPVIIAEALSYLDEAEQSSILSEFGHLVAH